MTSKHFLLPLLLLPLLVSAQDNIIDEVIWIVGDDAIYRSEVEEERLRAQYEGQQIQGDPYCFIPEQMAIQKLFLHQADLDSIVVSESTVSRQVDMQMDYYISQIGSREKMEEYFRKRSSDIREELMTNVRNQMIIQQMQSKLTSDINPTPADTRRFYESLPEDSLPTIPAQVEVQIISIEPPIPQEETERIKAQLREFTDRINNGASFAMLARLYSEDTESAKRGGELGFVGRGQLVPEFANVAFNLTNPNRVSRIVQSEYGYHIIQLIEKRGDRMNFRHILMRPRVSAADKERATQALDSLANRIRLGEMTFEQAVANFSSDKSTMMSGGMMSNEQTGTSKFEYQQLPQEVAKQVYSMKVGEVSAPFTMIDKKTNKEVCAIVRLKSRTETHKADLTNDYQTIREVLEARKSDALISDWIRRKQSETYVQIAPGWRNCDFQYDGWIRE